MERTIGNLGQEIRQPSKPYENLAEEGVRRSRVNALLVIMPELDDGMHGLPKGSVDLQDGFVLLRKRDKRPWLPSGEEAHIISEFIHRSISMAGEIQTVHSNTYFKECEVYLQWAGTTWRSPILC
ncbi:hypothetical protein EV401DRAFT_1415469 [Pisolithus croceorrhizus]|nr:hypothetical protein EV401DRAFT_1415469 [Pisolithus croceorrhizus]